MSQPITGSHPLPSMPLSSSVTDKYYHVKQNDSPIAMIGGLTLSVPAGLVVNVYITHHATVGDSTSPSGDWVLIGSAVTGAVEFPYKTGSCMGIRVQWVSGAGTITVKGEITEFSGGGGGTVSSPSVVTLSSLIEGEDQLYHRLATFNKLNYWTRISTATTTLVRTGVNTLVKLVIEVDLIGIVTFYDAITATGTPPLILPAGFKAGIYTLDLPLGVGLTIVTASADRLCVGGIFPA